MRNHVVMFSGGVGSWAAAKRVAERYGTERLWLLFMDTKMEDEDLYRFVREAAANVGGRLAWIAEGRDPWQVFFDERMMGNSRIDPCSRILKRQLAAAWLDLLFDPADTIVYVGIDWTEEHRFKGGRGKAGLQARRAAQGWRYEAPLCEPPFIDKQQMLEQLDREGIDPPRLYEMGFPHNNCGGFCVKAGQGHFANLLKQLPARYAYHEDREQQFRAFLGRDDISILRDRRGGVTRPLTLRELRERIQSGQEYDRWTIGGCNCFGGNLEDEDIFA